VVSSYQDEIWLALPERRRLDPLVLEFALDTARMAGTPGAPTRVLDLGCGDGGLAARLAAAGAEVTGLDPSREALARARKAHPDLKLAAPGPGGTLPFADSSFDAVVCMNVLQHVADTQLLLSEMRRVLVPAGHLAAAVPWHGVIKNLLIALRSFERHHDPLEPVLRFYTPGSLRALLRAFGFEEIEVRGAGGGPLVRETLLAQARRSSLSSSR
jgi:2-polyprenyl-6-hydroxyphenyl methylase/3-demethylubiquinone-9 3-methyltransferase